MYGTDENISRNQLSNGNHWIRIGNGFFKIGGFAALGIVLVIPITELYLYCFPYRLYTIGLF